MKLALVWLITWWLGGIGAAAFPARPAQVTTSAAASPAASVVASVIASAAAPSAASANAPAASAVSAASAASAASASPAAPAAAPTPAPKPIAPAEAANPDLTRPSDSTQLSVAIQQWMTVLARQTGFEAWKGASWASLPVGPGTHSWLVVIRKDRSEVGYMIVGALEDGKHYKLIEYGLGNQPIFGSLPLYRSMMQQELIDSSVTYDRFAQQLPGNVERFYLGPLAAFWKVSQGAQTYFFDAKTGELLPDLSDELPPPAQPAWSETPGGLAGPDPAADIKSAAARSPFDPWDHPAWITAAPLALATFDDFEAAFGQHSALTYVADIYDKKAIFSLAVDGYQQWSEDQVYVSLDDEGSCYFPLASLLKSGGFYQ